MGVGHPGVPGERTVCVWWPDWPVAALRAEGVAPAEGPVVVLDRGRVLAACSTARAEGVRRGMRRRDAESRCPGVAVLAADPAAEARVFEVVVRALDGVTARVSLERPGRCSFPTRGPSRYFGGDEPLAHRVLGQLAGVAPLLGLHDDPRVGVADGTFAARLAARRARPVHVVPAGDGAAFLAPWPVGVLLAADDPATADEQTALAGLLVRLGLRTLGDLAGLAPEAVLARFGPVGRDAHRLARGLDLHLPTLVEPPPDLAETHAFDPPAERVEAAVFAALPLAERFLGRLDDRGLGCTQVLVESSTEGGTVRSRLWRHDGALTPGALAERVRWQLDGWLTDRAVRGASAEPADGGLVCGGLVWLRLVPDQVVPAGGRQLGFWGGDQRAADRAGRCLARIQGLLGPEHVVTAVVQGGRVPAEQVRWVPWGEPRRPDRSPEAPWPGAVPPPSPAVVLDPPVPAELLDAGGRAVGVSGRGEPTVVPDRLRCPALPGGGGSVEGWAGPWVHDVRWWDPATHRRWALWQVVVGDAACLVVLEHGRAAVRALYD